MNMRKRDSIAYTPIRIGRKFREGNANIATGNRGWGPRSVNKGWDSGKLKQYASLWRRESKISAVDGLGVVGNRRELPSFDELGEAPGPTDNNTTTSTVSRSVFGMLDNAIKTVGGFVANKQNLEMIKAQGQADMRSEYMPRYSSSSSSSWFGEMSMLGLGALGVGVIGYFIMRSR
jgi:hypothetical protein